MGQPEDSRIANPLSAISGNAISRPKKASGASIQRGNPLGGFGISPAICFVASSACIAFADHSDYANDMFNFVFPHSRKNWQADESFPLGGGNGKILCSAAESFLVIRMQMQRPPVHRTSDTRLSERIDERIAIDLQLFQSQLDCEQVPRIDPVMIA